MKLDGQDMPVDDLEAMLPAVGVTLPPKSQLKGGTVATILRSSAQWINWSPRARFVCRTPPWRASAWVRALRYFGTGRQRLGRQGYGNSESQR